MHFSGKRNAPALALKAAQSNDLIATCAEIEDEIARVLTSKFRWSLSEVRSRLAELLVGSAKVEIEGRLNICRDPSDDMVLECAVLSGAQAIVTGDKDLLTLGTYQGIRIMTPAEYLALNG